ncbi:MAG: amidohydrolase family protein [Candidatus Zixiibacteriota bacterium]|nr:MAG: amidohydrolase family protein [candidate division Zixibacteria bacterium]
MKSAKLAAALFLLCSSILAHDYVPADEQDHPILLVGGNLFTVSGDVLNGTDLLFDNGIITQIGRDLVAPPRCEIIDVTGKNVYPGLIAPVTSLGLIEIGAVRATNDRHEMGRMTPEVKAHTAYNPDSEIIPTIRANGVTTVQVAPDGRLIYGRSCILNLDGWTVEDAAIKLVDAMHMDWPRASVVRAWWESRSAEEQRRDMRQNLDAIKQVFEDARTFAKARALDPTTPLDLRLDALVPVVKGEIPLFVGANDCRQIEQAVLFCKEQGIRMVLVGGREAWKVTDLLKENSTPVIYGSMLSLPMRQDYAYDVPFKVPKVLKDAGVQFCIAVFSATGVRNLPFNTGQAVAYGLDHADALRAVTLSTAEILGIDDQQGSLEIGKKATLIVSEGDILDYLGHRVTTMFIDGRAVDLDSKHKELNRKYRAKRVR